MSLKRARNGDELLTRSNKVIVRTGVDGSKDVRSVVTDATEDTTKNDKGQGQQLIATLANTGTSGCDPANIAMDGTENSRKPMRAIEAWRPEELRISSSRTHLEVVIMREDDEGYVAWHHIHLPDEIWVSIFKLIPIDQVCQIVQHSRARIVPTHLVVLLGDLEVLEASAQLYYGPGWMPPAMQWTRPSITRSNPPERSIDYYMLLNCNGCENCSNKRVFKKTMPLQARLCDACFFKFTVRDDRAAQILCTDGLSYEHISRILRTAKRCDISRTASDFTPTFYSIKDVNRLSAEWKEHFGPGKITNLTQEQWIQARDAESRRLMTEAWDVEIWLPLWANEKQKRNKMALKTKARDLLARAEPYHRRLIRLTLRLLDLDVVCAAFEDPTTLNDMTWGEIERQINMKWPELRNLAGFRIRSQRHANLIRRVFEECVCEQTMSIVLASPVRRWLWEGCYPDDYKAVKLLQEYGFITVKATEGWATCHDIYDDLILYFGAPAGRRLRYHNRNTRLDTLRSLLARVATQLKLTSPESLGQVLYQYVASGKVYDLSRECNRSVIRERKEKH